MKPVLLVTCKAGNEEWCEEEIGNVIFIHDPEVVVERTKYPGLLIVYSNLDPSRAYRIALSSEYGFVKNIIPIQCSVDDINDEYLIRKCVLSLVSPGETVKLKVRVRGIRGLSKKLWVLVTAFLKEINSSHDPKSSICLYIESIDSTLFIGKGKCSLEETS